MTPCWLWTGTKRNRGGYGQAPGRKLAHRASFEAFIGPIPDGLVVMHSCDTPACVNPDHLELGTAADNNRDRQAKGRSATGDRHGFRIHPDRIPKGTLNGKSKLNVGSVTEIRTSAETPDGLARRFGVSVDTVKRIRSGKYRAWKWLP